MKFNFEFNYETPTGTEIALNVEAIYHPAERGHRDSLGAPEEPDEDASIEVLEITGPGGEVYREQNFTRHDWERILNAANDYYDNLEFEYD
jgi:hypothetical protein